MKINAVTLTQYFAHLGRKQNKKMVLPPPNAKPKFGNEGEGLANRIAAMKFAGKVLKDEPTN